VDSPLQTLSCVFTWEPSSISWIVKSISGTCFFSRTARMALSRYTSWLGPVPSMFGMYGMRRTSGRV